MFVSNPFASVADVLLPVTMKLYVVLMILSVVLGTLFDISHKGSAKFFAQRRDKSRALAKRQLSGSETASLAVDTIAEAAVSGEFCKWPRRTSHLLMMYGFLLYVITTVALVFATPAAENAPVILPLLWALGAVMIVIGGLWFFFFLRVNVAFDGASPFHLGPADLFVCSLIASAALALLWYCVQSAYPGSTVAWSLFGLYIFFTTLLFVAVPWSKFAHMFFKPAAAFQKRVEEANGSSDLPAPTTQNFIVRS